MLRKTIFWKLNPRGLLFNRNHSTCIVGAGPGGLYTAKYLLNTIEDTQVTIIDMLPHPYGLVRSGVAPDHQQTKNVTNDFDRVLGNDRAKFLGNVSVGKDVSLSELQERFDAVVLSYGASDDRKLNIPGQELSNVSSARAFVNWYNGHPDFVDTKFDFSGESAVIVGQGNVAIDCSRILCKDVEELKKTDIADHALEQLVKSNIKTVHIVGRRGAAQASFTTKELRELVRLEGCETSVSEDDLKTGGTEASMVEVKETRGLDRRLKLYHECVKSNKQEEPALGDLRSLKIDFLKSPIEIVPDPLDKEKCKSIRFEKNELTGEAFNQKVKGTGKMVDIPASLILASIGYRGQKISPELPWNDQEGVVMSKKGRVENMPGVYCAGWIKRGCKGIIGTNIPDADETAYSIKEDKEGLVKYRDGHDSLLELLNERNVYLVDDVRWQRLDDLEKSMGLKENRPRVKICRRDEILNKLKD